MSLTRDNHLCRTALLTTEKGFLAEAAYKTLKSNSDLRAVIFSVKKNKKSKLSMLKEFGVWYALQSLISKAYYFLNKTGVVNVNTSDNKIHCKVWRNNDDEDKVADLLVACNVEVVVVCGFHHILNNDFITRFLHVINVHPSKLPAYRGPEPIIWGILDEQPNFGLSIHYLDDGIDTGDILAQYEINRPAYPLSALVEQRLSRRLPGELEKVIKNIMHNQARAIPQETGFYLPKPSLLARKLRKKL